MLPLYGEDVRLGMVYRHAAEWRHFQHIVKLHPAMRVLELGCGAGRWALRIAPHVREVVGVDFSEAMVRLARDRQEKLGIRNAEFRVAGAQDARWNETFDLIYFSGMTQHLSDEEMRQALGHVRAMLALGGVVIDRTSVTPVARKTIEFESGYQGVYRTLRELESLFGEFGFSLAYGGVSYARMRLPDRWMQRPRFQARLESALRETPSAALFFIDTMTRLLNWLRPRSWPEAPAIHHFFIFKPRHE